MKTGRVAKSRSTVSRALVATLLAAFACAAVSGAEDRAIKSKVAPVYPEVAKRLRISGAVKLEATVDADGKVSAVKTVSGNHMLSEAAEEAVHKWKFASAQAQSTEELTINFELKE